MSWFKCPSCGKNWACFWNAPIPDKCPDCGGLTDPQTPPEQKEGKA